MSFWTNLWVKIALKEVENETETALETILNKMAKEKPDTYKEVIEYGTLFITPILEYVGQTPNVIDDEFAKVIQEALTASQAANNIVVG